MSNPKHLVAIDIGSNSFHLIIAREQAGCIQVVHSQKQQINMALGLNDQNSLSKEVMQRGVDCLAEFSLTFSRLPSSSVRIVATQTLRKATNREEFIKAAFKVLPYPIEIISGKSEAELIYQGVAHTQPIRGRTLIIDIGGASTELVIGQGFKPRIAQSLELGSSQFYQQFFSDGVISKEQMISAQALAEIMLQPIADRYREFGWKTVLGTSSSIKSISLAMSELYGDNKITNKRLKRLSKQLVMWGHYELVPLQSIDNRRLPLMAGAVAILLACFNMLSIKQMSHSTGALREGVLYGLSDSRQDIDIRQRTVNSLAKLHLTDSAFSQRVMLQLQQFNEQLQRHQQGLNEQELRLLRWGAQLHEIGISINHKQRQHHGRYIIEHSEMPGFSEQEQEVMMFLIGNHRGKIAKAIDFEETNLLKLTQLLRLAIIFTQGRLNILPRQILMQYLGDDLSLGLNTPVLQSLELMELIEKEIKQMAKFGLTLQVDSLAVAV
ncbi:MAG: Ppx/GppA family phosphatase [Gammaproteobacteria bacterium]|nr:Ppx/GppA family phosphatase [Gammaproteobacteria bacterium]